MQLNFHIEGKLIILKNLVIPGGFSGIPRVHGPLVGKHCPNISKMLNLHKATNVLRAHQSVLVFFVLCDIYWSLSNYCFKKWHLRQVIIAN